MTPKDLAASETIRHKKAFHEVRKSAVDTNLKNPEKRD